jgi:hypothetical protein
VADNWDEAKREWALDYVYLTARDEPGACLCGHPIFEHCVLYNRRNGNVAVVGNVCVNKFLGLPSKGIFAGFRKVMKNERAALTAQAVLYAFGKGWIDDWEKGFYLNTYRLPWGSCCKRHLSENRRPIRVRINRKVLSRLSAASRGVERG